MSTHVEVSDALARRCDEIIAAELARLRRRRPGLSPHQLDAVDQALRDLAERFVLDPVRRNPAHASSIDALFVLGRETPSPSRGRR